MSDPVRALAEKHFGISNGELLVGGIPVSVLAQRYGTPSYIYDARVIDAKLKALRTALPSRFEVHFSVKANPNKIVLQHFLSYGCGLEIASAGEFHHALNAGCKPENILFAGPGKTEAEIELVLSNGIGEIHLESLVEAKRVSAISR